MMTSGDHHMCNDASNNKAQVNGHYKQGEGQHENENDSDMEIEHPKTTTNDIDELSDHSSNHNPTLYHPKAYSPTFKTKVERYRPNAEKQIAHSTDNSPTQTLPIMQWEISKSRKREFHVTSWEVFFKKYLHDTEPHKRFVHETIREDNPIRMFVEFDIKGNDSGLADKCVKCFIHEARKYLFEGREYLYGNEQPTINSPDDILVFDTNSSRESQQSRHLTFENVWFGKLEIMKAHVKCILEIITQKYPQYIGENGIPCGIDVGVYHHNKSLRIVGSRKYDKPYHLIPHSKFQSGEHFKSESVMITPEDLARNLLSAYRTHALFVLLRRQKLQFGFRFVVNSSSPTIWS